MKKFLKIFGIAILGIIYFGVLEINKHTLLGWVAAIVVTVAFLLLKKRLMRDTKGLIKCVYYVAYLALLLCALLISRPKERCIDAVKVKNPELTTIVSVSEGDVQGVFNKDKTVEVFAGIPYAKPPVGELRWQAPKPAEKYSGVRVCDKFAPMAMQVRSNSIMAFGSSIIGYGELPISLHDNYLEAMSEDCLYLNVWRPAGAKEGDNLPVLFYVHGGSLNSGQSYWESYNGEKLASQGIIVVNIAYRVGVFGYLADEELASESANGTTGNYGLLDQIQALKWVNENVGKFGGDASNITIAGESAGASSVNALCVSPLTEGLFRRVIAESSGIVAKVPYHTFRTMDQALEVGNNIKKEFGCDSIEELRKIPADKLVNTRYSNNEMTVDGYAIVEQPYLTYEAGRNHEEAIFNGFNGDEGTVFLMFGAKPTVETYEQGIAHVAGDYASELAALKPATDNKTAAANYNELIGLAWFGYSHYVWSNYTAAQGVPTYLYLFNKENGALGPWHAGELEYFYGNMAGLDGFKKRNVHTFSSTYDESDYALSRAMQTYYLNFIKTGDPNNSGDGTTSNLPIWETYNENPDKLMLFDENIGMIKNEYIDVFKIYDKEMDKRAEE